MPGAQSYESSIINQLRITDPQLDTGLGTPIRKIISAVAGEISNYSNDVAVTNTLYSLNAVSGQELDYLVGQFGFTRQEARAARGTIRISRDNADSVMQIGYGSQFYKAASSTSPTIVFQTTAYQELAEGVLSAEISVIASVAGSSGNVPADTITYSTSYSGYITVTNDSPTTGGRDMETDEELRRRFLDTVFRNEAGTRDQYLGLALAHALVTRASLVGQETRFSEVVQVKSSEGDMIAEVSSNLWDSEVDHLIDSEYRYWVTRTDSDTMLSRGEYEVQGSGESVRFFKKMESELVGPCIVGQRLSLAHIDVSDLTVVKNDGSVAEPGADYVLDAKAGSLSFPASTSITTGDSVTCTYRYYDIYEGDFVTIEFDYLSRINRGELKSVELLIDGINPQKVSDIEYIDFSKKVTVSNQSRWLRDDLTPPVVGHVYVPLSYQPAYASTGQMNVGTSTILREDEHFRFLYDQTKKRGSSRSMDAVEILGFVQKVNDVDKLVLDDTRQPAMGDETPVNIPYYYNNVVETVQKLIDQQSVVTMDCLVHEAKRRYFGIYLTMMFSVFPRDDIKQQVVAAVIAWAKNLPFGATIQLSDIETVAANVSGVDNVRVSFERDASGKNSPFVPMEGEQILGAFGVVECARNGETAVAQFTEDFQLAQDEVFEVQFVEIYSRTQQGWN